jgi:DNA modification methylase
MSWRGGLRIITESLGSGISVLWLRSLADEEIRLLLRLRDGLHQSPSAALHGLQAADAPGTLSKALHGLPAGLRAAIGEATGAALYVRGEDPARLHPTGLPGLPKRRAAGIPGTQKGEMMDEGTGVQLLQGDCRARLGELEAESVHLILTSPPYHGLRDYGTGGWEGGDDDCAHKGVDRYYTERSAAQGSAEAFSEAGEANAERLKKARWREKGDCACGASRVDQQIGLEDSAEAHIAVLVDVFREARRVLRPDGCLIVNYGDAYAGSWGNQGRKEERGTQRPINGPMMQNLEVGYPERKGGSAPELPAKNLLMLPSRLAIALQADGWILRSMMPWLKRSAMPESATDRPSSAIEYVFIFSKSQRYFWDADAVRRKQQWGPNSHSHGTTARPKYEWPTGQRPSFAQASGGDQYNPNGRNLRNSDFYFDSLDLAIEATRFELAHLLHLREKGGLLLDGEGEPLALDVNPQALADAHFASFPEKLVAPLIQAGSSEHGVCGTCGAPWVRVVEKEYRSPAQYKDRTSDKLVEGTVGAVLRMGDGVDVRTTGWQPSCKCNGSVVPATILDPFAGSGTTSLVASKLGRRSIAIELSQPYTEIFNRRNSQKSLLL